MVTTADKRTYIFSGAHFWEVKDTGGADGPFEIKDYWRDLEENIDAAYTVQAFDQTIFIKGDRYVLSILSYLFNPEDCWNSMCNFLKTWLKVLRIFKKKRLYQ